MPYPFHITPFCDNWAQDQARSSPSPLPDDVLPVDVIYVLTQTSACVCCKCQRVQVPPGPAASLDAIPSPHHIYVRLLRKGPGISLHPATAPVHHAILWPLSCR